MSENQLIIASGTIGPQGAIGPQGSTIGITGSIGPTGPAGGVVFPYDVTLGDANFYNIGMATASSGGQFILNSNGGHFNNIIGATGFAALNFDYLIASASSAVMISNNNGASYSWWFDNTNGPVRIDSTLIVGGMVIGLSGSGFGATGPQGPIGPQGNQGASVVGPTGGTLGWPVDLAVTSNVNILDIGTTSGSMHFGINGIGFNNIQSNAPASILFSNIIGASYGIWLDNTVQSLQIDCPTTFTNTVISTLYLNNSILFNISGGSTPAVDFLSLTSSAPSAIHFGTVSGASYGVHFSHNVENVQFDCPVNFTGAVTGLPTSGIAGTSSYAYLVSNSYQQSATFTGSSTTTATTVGTVSLVTYDQVVYSNNFTIATASGVITFGATGIYKVQSEYNFQLFATTPSNYGYYVSIALWYTLNGSILLNSTAASSFNYNAGSISNLDPGSTVVPSINSIVVSVNAGDTMSVFWQPYNIVIPIGQTVQLPQLSPSGIYAGPPQALNSIKTIINKIN